MLHEIYKRNGPVTSCQSYSDVVLSDDVAKLFGTLVCGASLPGVSRVVNQTQFGAGFHGGETSTAHLYVPCMMDLACSRGRSVCLVFLDIATAFASLLRRIVHAIDSGDEEWLHKLWAAGFSEEDIQSIYRDVCRSAWADAEANTCALALATELHRYMWNSQEGLKGVLWTSRGTGAGAPLGRCDLHCCNGQGPESIT